MPRASVAMAVESVPLHLCTLISKIADKNDFENCAVRYKPINTAGGNFTASLFDVNLEKDGEVLKLFAKISNTSEKSRRILDASKLFQRETFVYTDLAEDFDGLQETFNVPVDNRFKFIKYYGSELSEMEEAIVLENMSAKGYEVHDRLRSMDWEYARKAIEELGRFHALSHALRLEDPEKYDRLIRNKNEVVITARRDPERNSSYTRAVFALCIEAVDEAHVPALRGFISGFADSFPKHFEPTPHSVLAHGDYRISNHMVKYQEGSITSLVVLDYQNIFHGSGINDLMYLIFTGTDSDFRRAHFDSCVQLYRDSLERSLAALSRDVELVYPRQLFMEHIKEKLLYGLGVAMFLTPMLLVQPGEEMQLEELLSRRKGPQASALFKERFRGIVEDMVRWGALQL